MFKNIFLFLYPLLFITLLQSCSLKCYPPTLEGNGKPIVDIELSEETIDTSFCYIPSKHQIRLNVFKVKTIKKLYKDVKKYKQICEGSEKIQEYLIPEGDWYVKPDSIFHAKFPFEKTEIEIKNECSFIKIPEKIISTNSDGTAFIDLIIIGKGQIFVGHSPGQVSENEFEIGNLTYIINNYKKTIPVYYLKSQQEQISLVSNVPISLTSNEIIGLTINDITNQPYDEKFHECAENPIILTRTSELINTNIISGDKPLYLSNKKMLTFNLIKAMTYKIQEKVIKPCYRIKKDIAPNISPNIESYTETVSDWDDKERTIQKQSKCIRCEIQLSCDNSDINYQKQAITDDNGVVQIEIYSSKGKIYLANDRKIISNEKYNIEYFKITWTYEGYQNFIYFYHKYLNIDENKSNNGHKYRFQNLN